MKKKQQHQCEKEIRLLLLSLSYRIGEKYDY